MRATMSTSTLAALAAFTLLVSASVARADHPDPRVIINVRKVAGPHESAALQRDLRASLWGKVIACYRPGALKNQKLSGWTTVRFDVSRAGKAKAGKLVKTSLKDRSVAMCLAKLVAKAPLEPARRGSTVTADFYVAPGDVEVR